MPASVNLLPLKHCLLFDPIKEIRHLSLLDASILCPSVYVSTVQQISLPVNSYFLHFSISTAKNKCLPCISRTRRMKAESADSVMANSLFLCDRQISL